MSILKSLVLLDQDSNPLGLDVNLQGPDSNSNPQGLDSNPQGPDSNLQGSRLEPAGSGLESVMFRFTDLPAWEMDALLIRSSHLVHT